MPYRLPAIPAVVLLLVLPACQSRPDGEPGHTFRVTRQEGVPVAETRGGPKYAGDILTFTPLDTLKEDPEREESLFYSPRAFVQSPEGEYFLYDSGHCRIMVFGSGGDYRRSFSREGQGPGELSSMAELHGFIDGRLVLFDRDTQRTIAFDPDGTMTDLCRSMAGWRAELMLPLDGDLVGYVRQTADTGPEYRQRWREVLIGRRGTRDTISCLMTERVTEAKVTYLDDNRRRITELRFSPSAIALPVPGRGILITSGRRPELTWHDTSGDLTLHIVLDLPLLPVTAEVKAAYWRDLEAGLRLAYERHGIETPVDIDRSLYFFVDEIGFWNEALVDDFGYIWLQDVYSFTTEAITGQCRFHILSPEGEYLGTARVPTGLYRSMRLSGGKLCLITYDQATGDSAPVAFAIASAIEGWTYP